MTAVVSGALRGSIRWAIVPYPPQPPFRLYAGEEQAPIVVTDAERIIAGARKEGGDVELTYLVPAKVRPVLILSDPPSAHHRELTALRLLRLSKLSPEAREEVRQGQDRLFLYLPRERFGFREENAAMVSAMVRLHTDAIGHGPSLGRIDDDEMRELGERIIDFYGFDTRRLLDRRIRELAARRR